MRRRRVPPARAATSLQVVLAGLGWLVVALLATAAVARIVDWDGTLLFVAIDATNGLFYLPAWVVLFGAAAGRRLALGLAALAVVAAQLAFAAPELLAASALPSWTAHAPTLRLLDANVGADEGNTDMAGYEHQIAAVRPDLVTLEEASPRDVTLLEHSPALHPLTHRFEVVGAAPWGFEIASRYPFRVTGVLWAGGNPFLVTASVRSPQGSFRLWVVHTDAPVASMTLWSSDLRRIAARARTRGTGRLLVAGDFNASWGNKGFRAVVDSGLVDAAAARGRPFDMTWPQGEWFPPLVRIDHVLTGAGLAVSSINAGEGPGSDHHDLVASVAFEPAARRPR